MAFTAIVTSEIDVGDPVKAELFDKVRTNFDDHESRLVTVEAATTSIVPIDFELLGPYSGSGAPQVNVLNWRVPFNITILNIRLIVINAGTAGTTEIDMFKSTDGGATFPTSFFSTKPSVGFGAGNYAISTNQVLAVTTAASGDWLRLNITAVQTAAADAIVRIDYEPS